MGQSGSMTFDEAELKRLNAHEKTVTCCSVAPNDKILATCSTDGSISLWNLATGELLHCFRTPENWEVTSVCFNGPVMASSHSPPKSSEKIKDGLVYIWRYQTSSRQPKPRRSSRLASHHDGVLQCAFSRDGEFLASVSKDTTGRVYKIKPGAGEFVPGTEIQKLLGHRAPVNTVQFTPDNSFVLTGSDDNTVRVWKCTRDQRIKTDTVACIFTMNTHGPVRNLCIFTLTEYRNTPTCLTYTSGNRIEVCQLNDQGRCEKLYGLDTRVDKRPTSIAHAPNSSCIVTTFQDNTVTVWDPFAKQKPFIREIISKDGISCCCFNSNGQIFVVGDGRGSVYICGQQESEQLAATLV